jgi:hypothetical protein
MKLTVAVVQTNEIKKILAFVGLPTETPRVHPARGPPGSDSQNELWKNAAATEWDEASVEHPEPADQDQSLHG